MKIHFLFFFLCFVLPAHSQNTGIGTINPLEFFSVGASSQFRINPTGDVVRIKNIQYSFPSFQGATNTVLTNDGSGNLSWSQVLVTVGSISVQSGTPSPTTFLRGDGSWQSMSSNIILVTSSTIGAVNNILSTLTDLYTSPSLATGAYIVVARASPNFPNSSIFELLITLSDNTILDRNSYFTGNFVQYYHQFTTVIRLNSSGSIKLRAGNPGGLLPPDNNLTSGAIQIYRLY